MPQKIYAVLTGDLIRSSKLDAEQLKHAGNILEESVSLTHDLAGAHGLAGGPVLGPIDFFRGDSWQVVSNMPHLALRIAILFRARLKAFSDSDTRIAIGIGVADDEFHGSPSQAVGEAFLLSGHALDEMKGFSDLTVALPERAGHLCRWAPALAALCDAVVTQWTQRQAEIGCLALLDPDITHEQIGTALPKPVARQTVTRSLHGAHWRPLEQSMAVFADTDWEALLS